MSELDLTLTRENLMRQFETSWNALGDFIASLTEEQLTRPTDAAGWTAKDHIAHVAIWEIATLALLERRSEREALEMPPEIWKQGEDAENEVLYERSRGMSLAEVMQALEAYHAPVAQKLAAMTEEELLLPYRHYQPESTDERPLLRWLIWGTAGHYRDHVPWIQAIIDQA